MYINKIEKLDRNEDTERDWEYLNRLLKKYVCKKRETVEKKKHILKTIDKYNGNKEEEMIRPLFALGLLWFYSSLNVINLLAATKNLKLNYTFLLKQNVFY